MTKKIKLLTLSTVVLATVGICGMSITDSIQVSDVAIANIEALTSEESVKGEKYTCYESIHTKDGCQVRYCGTCEYVPGTDRWYSKASECTY